MFVGYVRYHPRAVWYHTPIPKHTLKYTNVKVPCTTAEQLHLALLLPNKKPCWCQPTRVCWHHSTGYLRPLELHTREGPMTWTEERSAALFSDSASDDEEDNDGGLQVRMTDNRWHWTLIGNDRWWGQGSWPADQVFVLKCAKFLAKNWSWMCSLSFPPASGFAEEGFQCWQRQKRKEESSFSRDTLPHLFLHSLHLSSPLFLHSSSFI